MQVTLDLPKDLAMELQAKWGDLSRAAVESVALEAHRSGALTHSQLRRLLGFTSRDEVDGFLKRHSIFLEYTIADLASDLENSRRARH